MKKVFSILLVLAMLVCFMATSASAAEGGVSGSSATAADGKATVSFTVTREAGFYSYKLYVTYDSTKLSNPVVSDGVTANTATPGKIVVGFMNTENVTSNTFSVTFTVDGDCKASYSVSAEMKEFFYFENGTNVETTGSNGSATITVPHTPGAAATCTTAQTCTVCGTELASELGHSFTSYTSNNDATCTADGTKTAKCDRCDVTDTVADTGSKLDHSFTNYTSNDDATCTEDGTKTAKCDRCDVTDTVADTGSKLGHSFTNYTSNNDATCLADGTKTAKCDRCDVTDTVADTGSKLEHSFTNYTSNDDATCLADGTKTAKCDRCDATDTVADAGTKLGHIHNFIDNKNGTHDEYCTRCETLLADNETCYDVNPKDGKCDGCGAGVTSPDDNDDDDDDDDDDKKDDQPKNGDITPYPVYFLLVAMAAVAVSFGLKRKFDI